MRYFVNRNAQPNGDHEVHVPTCDYFPAPANLQFLGEYDNCFAAVREARRFYPRSNGCYFCCRPCHTT